MAKRRATAEDLSHYLGTLERLGVVPNFWTSAEYLLRSGAYWLILGELSGFHVYDDEWFLPPLNNGGPYLDAPIYAGFPDQAIPGAEFLDYQIIYDPRDFQDLSGGRWQTFRKNVRKYPVRTPGFHEYRRLVSDEYLSELSRLLTSWAEGRDVFDPDTFVRFVLNGDNRKGLFVDGRLVGLNVWDENYRYVNFRYCVDDSSPFLNEYMRYLFYTDTEILQTGKLVNDGGALGSEALFRFKQKLNPCQIMKVYSYPGKE